MFANQLKMYHFYHHTSLGTINIRPKNHYNKDVHARGLDAGG